MVPSGMWAHGMLGVIEEGTACPRRVGSWMARLSHICLFGEAIQQEDPKWLSMRRTESR